MSMYLAHLIPFFYCISRVLLTAEGHPISTNSGVRKDNIDERGKYFEGDIKLPPGIMSGIIGDQYRWTEQAVIYEIGSDFTSSEQMLIYGAMDEISLKTCLKFKERSSEEDYIYIQRGGPDSGCWSYVGRLGGRQELNLQAGSPGCIFHGIIAHELIHAIGYFHEQSRTDRDDYVLINWGNIQPGTEQNFESYNSSTVDPHDVAYDYGSIMHYSAYAFAVNQDIPTIFPVDTTAEIGQRIQLSASDAVKIRNMYKC